MTTYSKKYLKNSEIYFSEVRVIDSQGENLGILKTSEAIKLAKESDLDLVLISNIEDTPVCKIINWSKLKYENSKKTKSTGRQAKQKEWQFKPKIQDHDIEVKLSQIKKVLIKGTVVKLTVKAQKKSKKEDLEEVLNKIIEKVSDFSDKIGDIIPEGQNLSLLIKRKNL